MSAHKPKCIALTGGIASGKTTISDKLKAANAVVIDADDIAHECLRQTEIILQIEELFGESVVSVMSNHKTIDRQKLGALVFSDAKKRQALEAILHPPIIKSLKALRDAAASTPSLAIILVIPLLGEMMSGKREKVVRASLGIDEVIVVDCEPSVQIKRLQSRNNLSSHEANQRVAAQIERTARLNFADHIIHNSGDVSALNVEIDANCL